MHVYVQDSPRVLVLISGDDPDPLSQDRRAAAASASGNNGAIPPASEADLVTGLLISAAPQQGLTSVAKAVVQLVKSKGLEDLSLQKLTPRSVAGCLGLINVGHDLFVAVVTSAQEVGAIRPGEVIMRITSVSFYCVNRSIWDESLISDSGGGGVAGGVDPYDANAVVSETPIGQPSLYEHPCASLKKLLGTGTFYYAKGGGFDISTRLDKRISSPHSGNLHDLSQYDSRFVWNNYMIEPLMEFRERLEPSEKSRFDSECFLLLAIQGFVGVYDMFSPVPFSSSSSSLPSISSMNRQQSTVSLISRLSWKRAGTRFNTRGVDDDGNVANFVETETIFHNDEATYSYNQVRGSVPLFWEQQGLQAFNARIQITRPRIASQPAFDRHFADLIFQYSHVHAINLLGTRDAETVLSAAYAEHMRNSAAEGVAILPSEEGVPGRGPLEDDLDRMGLTNFDFHATSRALGGLEGVRNELKFLGPVQLKRKAFGCLVIDPSDGRVLRQQKGVFRTNCLDCLDRTNVIQDMLSQATLESFMEAARNKKPSFEPFTAPTHALWTHHRVLWAENGDALSKIYAGTGALNTSFTRSGKKTLGGLLSDAAKSAGRMYINNFQDKGKQNVIDVLLGNMANQKPVTIFDPIADSVAAELNARVDEYSTSGTISIFTGTFNLNGKSPGESLLPWLFPDEKAEEPDIFALGFQEIVQLTPQQILMTDPDKIRIWESTIVDTLSRRQEKRSDYVLLRSEQLVGTALVILIKEELVGHVRQIEAAYKKTGLKGMSGNKGGVAVRLDYRDTSICFVTAHFAAGHSNHEERNADYWTITRGLTFQRGRTIANHDHVIWLGDFNYRIDLPNETVRSMASRDDFQGLYLRDQLGRSRELGAVFPGYSEGVILFRPTYKYDNGSNVYDSSEKQRIPAWTDRILYRGEGLEQQSYYRAELKTSDHRPVYSCFTAKVRTFDEVKKNEIKRQLMMERRRSGGNRNEVFPPNGFAHHAVARGVEGCSDEEASSDDPDLPPPSTDERKWWESEARRARDGEEISSDDQSDSSDSYSHSDEDDDDHGGGDGGGGGGREGKDRGGSMKTSVDLGNPFRKSQQQQHQQQRGRLTQGRSKSPPSKSSQISSFRSPRPPPPLPGTTATTTGLPRSVVSTSTSFQSPRPPARRNLQTSKAVSPTSGRRIFSSPSKPPKPFHQNGQGGSGIVGDQRTPLDPTGNAGNSENQRPPPPPIPVKPSVISSKGEGATSGAVGKSGGGGEGKVESKAFKSGVGSKVSRPPIAPPRPSLGPRSASYSSQKSSKSLLDDSDSEDGLKM
ncbi:hypothetical protein IE53DRAFT_368846 [Violaceomyces palustris]|uniref:Uncharacterized protein n=1 Tax=Violaceomyces palustris TaxID=1673888 RepID=A0ACD0NXF3_9BASI|nr:hypothetical protein IE53DRAFT_368846 [Violaceomyces palustris]